MKKITKVNLITCAIVFAVGAAAAWFYISPRWNENMELVEQYHVLCDAFTIPGLLMICMGMLMSLNNVGALDTLAYLLSYIPKMLMPAAFGEAVELAEFVENRRENRKKGYGPLYIVGAIYLGLAVVFLALFYSV